MPHELAVQVERAHAVAAKLDVEPLAVADRRAGGEPVLEQSSRVVHFGQGRRIAVLPEQLAGGAIETQDVSNDLLGLLPGETGHQDALADDNRTGRTRAGQLHLPGKVVLGPPLDRRLARAADAVAVGPTKTRPVFSEKRRGQETRAEREKGNKRE